VASVVIVCVGGLTGKYGNTLDAKASKDIMADTSDGDSGSDSDAEAGGGLRKSILSQKKKEEAAVCINHSVTEPCSLQTMDHHRYGYIPITGTKPCIYTVAMFEDFRKRLFHSNILSRINDDLVSLSDTLKLNIGNCFWYYLMWRITCQY